MSASSEMLLLDSKGSAGCFQHGVGRRAPLSRARLFAAIVFLFPHRWSACFLHKLLAGGEFSSSPNQTVEYLQMKGAGGGGGGRGVPVAGH